jgi:hypothetical protein
MLLLGSWRAKNLPTVGQIPTELIEAERETLSSENFKFIILIWDKEELAHQWKMSVVIPIRKRSVKNRLVIIAAYHWCQRHTKFYPAFFSLG